MLRLRSITALCCLRWFKILRLLGITWLSCLPSSSSDLILKTLNLLFVSNDLSKRLLLLSLNLLHLYLWGFELFFELPNLSLLVVKLIFKCVYSFFVFVDLWPLLIYNFLQVIIFLNLLINQLLLILDLLRVSFTLSSLLQRIILLRNFKHKSLVLIFQLNILISSPLRILFSSFKLILHLFTLCLQSISFAFKSLHLVKSFLKSLLVKFLVLSQFLLCCLKTLF